MNVNEYAEKIVNDFVHDITDNLFLYIEQDEERKKDYTTNLNRFGVQDLHMALGEKIKTMLNLDNDGECKDPKSTLIKGYTFHKLK